MCDVCFVCVSMFLFVLMTDGIMWKTNTYVEGKEEINIFPILHNTK